MAKLVKCPHCEKRNFEDSEKCSSCGKSLIPPATPSSPTSVPPPIPVPPLPIPVTPPIPPPHVPAPVPSPTPISPLPVPVPPAPSPGGGFRFDLSNPRHEPLHKRYGYPPLEGEVIDTRDVSVKVDPKWGFADYLRTGIGCLLLPFQPILALLTLLGGGNKPKETQNIATFRVNAPDGTTSQARIEQDYTGATIDLGDYVFVWGRQNKGVWIVEHAYNETVRGELDLK